jgi:hypothetical protein
MLETYTETCYSIGVIDNLAKNGVRATAGGSSMKCFVIMPFRQEFNAVHATIKRAVAATGVGEALRLDEVRAAGHITSDLIDELHAADFCIADMTDPNANVMWEVGYAAALTKPTIVIRHSTGALPFDVKDVRVVQYAMDALDQLEADLIDVIGQTSRRYQARRIYLPPRSASTVAITGTMNSSPDKVSRRLETLLPPYFGSDTTWYTGTAGNVDEMSAEYLLRAGQRVIGVGYAQLDVSSRMLRILETYGASFVDSSREQVLELEDAPSSRDVLFVQKADLVILLWDGNSVGIRQLADWMRARKQNHLLAFA